MKLLVQWPYSRVELDELFFLLCQLDVDSMKLSSGFSNWLPWLGCAWNTETSEVEGLRTCQVTENQTLAGHSRESKVLSTQAQDHFTCFDNASVGFDRFT